MQTIQKISSTLAVVLLFILIFFSIGLIEKGNTAKIYKSDYATLHSVEFGMFNSDVWTEKITSILDEKIETFDLNTNNRTEIKSYIQTIIDTLVSEAERVVKERNSGKRGFLDSILGSTKQMITDSIIDFKDLRKRIPEFTDAVMIEVEKPQNQARAKKVIREKIKAFMQEKYTHNTNMTEYKNILKKYKTDTIESCNTLLDTKIKMISNTMQTKMYIMLSITLIIILLIFFQRLLTSLGLFVLSSTTITLLISGVVLPMLDIEAKIAQLNFTILDKPIIFENQILFFQSKSISDLVSLLLDSGEARMILVGILLVMFSIIFPTLKLIATTMYYYSKNIIGNNPITRFFALHSTKWSMADVFVVSIFMAYLGLDGVVSNELKHLETRSTPVNIITSNGTHLEVGFFLFLSFVLTSFVLAYMVKKSKRS